MAEFKVVEPDRRSTCPSGLIDPLALWVDRLVFSGSAMAFEDDLFHQGRRSVNCLWRANMLNYSAKESNALCAGKYTRFIIFHMPGIMTLSQGTAFLDNKGDLYSCWSTPFFGL